MTSNGLGMDCSSKFFLTADIISLAVDSGVTSGNKLGKLFTIVYRHRTVVHKYRVASFFYLPNYRFLTQTGVDHIWINTCEMEICKAIFPALVHYRFR